MLSQFFIISSRGDVLINKDYRGDGLPNAAEVFLERLKQCKGADLAPAEELEGRCFVHVKRNGLYFVCTSRSDLAPFATIELLSRVSSMVKDYCGVLTDEGIRRNFALVYELLEEVIDYGYVQTTSTKSLKPYIRSDAEVVKADSLADVGFLTLGPGLFGAEFRFAPSHAAEKPIPVSPSSQGSSRNEVYVDVIERMTVLMTANGSVIRSEVNGSLQMKTFIVGNPELKLGLSEDLVLGKTSEIGYGTAVRLDQAQFHPSVDLADFEHKRALTIHPSEGECTIMRYSITGELPSQLPFHVSAVTIEVEDKQCLEVQLEVQCDLPSSSHAVDVDVHLPVPKATTDVTASVSAAGQAAEYKPQEKIFTWTIKKFYGASKLKSRIRIQLSQLHRATVMELGPVSLQFEIKNFVSSHLEVKYMKLFDRQHSYVPFRWVRYVTLSDSYTVRLR
ncbi:AP-4 complex subunit mu-1-like [Acanthaster planci]|uniref:AP-4 complex subunit mu-1-like n=1 Tax=Acanthaster planci TaxID=133434 RepID=A0A8B7Y115_ACAPL|nr:AP-4 complex subunit mu-1-like [Acanthaster planci]